MKKLYFLFTLLIISSALLLTGCGNKQASNSEAEKGNLNYKNKDLGFSLSLPAEFIYYQTQRKDADDYKDLEIFIPTSDKEYAQEVSGYAKPIVIRIVDKTKWDNNAAVYEDNLYEKIGDKGGKVYAIRFWKDIPKDWASKWSDEMKQEITREFKNI